MENEKEELTPEELEKQQEEEREQKLCLQIESEYQLADEYIQPKRNEWIRRLKLYNNQSRAKGKVGDPLLFTVFQTVFSSLYDDRLKVSFEPNARKDDETAENLNDLAEHDYRVMGKDQLDYDWDWNACFFGRSLMILDEFDREENRLCPIAEVVDPLLWLRDPRATSVNGDMRGRGAMRFGGRPIFLTKSEMEDLEFKNLDKLLRDSDEINATDEVKQGRDEARGTASNINKEKALTENYEYELLEWFTIIDGQKKVVTTGNNRKLILREREIEGNEWPIYDRPLFPIAHDWDGVSIPDLIEDKQRARAKMVNLGLDAAIADLHPMYLYNKKKIRNKRDLDFAFNKAVGVDGDVNNAYQPMQKANTVSQQAQNIMNILDIASQKALAAPEIAQGVAPRQERTLGEQEMVAAARGSRMSLAASIFGWSEKRFWQQWYNLYKRHLADKDIDEKVIRLKGLLAPKWRVLTKDNLIASVDPDVRIESVRVAEARRQQEVNEFSRFYELAVQDPQTNRPFLNRRMARILNIKTDEMRLLFPPSPDEILAEIENETLNENKFVPGNHFDDHIMHIQINSNANANAATAAHLEFHRKMIMAQKENPEAFPQLQQQEPGQPELQTSTPPTPTESGSPRETRASLMTGQ
jgi:hypothetical protein